MHSSEQRQQRIKRTRKDHQLGPTRAQGLTLRLPPLLSLPPLDADDEEPLEDELEGAKDDGGLGDDEREEHDDA